MTKKVDCSMLEYKVDLEDDGFEFALFKSGKEVANASVVSCSIEDFNSYGNQGDGYGTCLYNHIENFLHNKGCRTINLRATVEDGATIFWEKMSFKFDFKNPKNNPGLDDYRMIKHII